MPAATSPEVGARTPGCTGAAVVTGVRDGAERETVEPYGRVTTREGATAVRAGAGAGADALTAGTGLSPGVSRTPRSVTRRYDPGAAVMATTLPRPTLRGEPNQAASP